MTENANSFIYDKLLPILFYKLDDCIPAEEKLDEYAKAKRRLCIRKNRYNWDHPMIEHKPSYSLCWATGPTTDQLTSWYVLDITAKDAIYVRDVTFYLKKSKLKNKFSYDFSTHQNEHLMCSAIDMCLPRDVEEQIQSQIEHRYSKEILKCGSTLILNPNETCEEVLVERDLSFKV